MRPLDIQVAKLSFITILCVNTERIDSVMTDFVAHHDIGCVFPMSGQYGIAPRALYYALLLFVAILQNQDWLTAGAAAACLTFGGSAAIHALILAPIFSLGHTGVSDGNVQLQNGTLITIVALANDLDTDATLAIVGTGFLIVVPMALWSARFKVSGAVPILVLWIILMSISMVASMANLYAIDRSTSGPLKQFRFCSPGFNETFPVNSNNINVVHQSWNDTVWTYFDSLHGSQGGCYYPCLGATNLLRNPGDAEVLSFLDITSPDLSQRSVSLYFILQVVSAIVYSCVPLSILFCLVILILRLRGQNLTNSNIDIPEKSFVHRALMFTTWSVNVYAKILIWVIFPVFLCWAEWTMYYDPQSEAMQLVGQWAPLVGAGLAFIAAIVGKYFGPMRRFSLNFWQRRDVVRINGPKESIWDSSKDVWNYDTSTAWSRVGSANYRIEGTDSRFYAVMKAVNDWWKHY